MYQQKFAAHLQAAAPLLGRVEQEYHQAKTIYKDPGADKRRKGQIDAIYAAHNNCRPWKLFAYVAVQAPIFLSFFFGIKDLVRVFPDITSGGMLWALDLSASDPYNVLPVLASFSFLAVLESNLRSRQVLRLVPSCPPRVSSGLTSCHRRRWMQCSIRCSWACNASSHFRQCHCSSGSTTLPASSCIGSPTI